MSTVKMSPNDADAWVDDAILEFLNPDKFKSFFLFAGAGSGKTRTLVNVLAKFKDVYGELFRLNRQKVAIITYTNAAADEIVHRLEYHPILQVSTIHSFAWELIKPFTTDIREWLRSDLETDIAALKEEQSRSKNLQNKTSIDRAKRIESKIKRLQLLDKIVKFTYNPNGDNISTESLNHAEVIKITANFISSKPLMKRLFACRYPILLIDESQDTKKELIDAIFSLQQAMPQSFCVGLFGDTMQRIYADGKENLQSAFPKNWKTPKKKLNHRSNKRIITLINNIRQDVDGQKQESRVEKLNGIVRLFICPRGSDKQALEGKVAKKMSEITQDPLWDEENNNVKTLILEHHMAARRMGFFEFFVPLYKSRLSTGMLDGTLPGIALLTKIILPLLNAHRRNDKYEIARILKKESLLLRQQELKQSKDQLACLKKCWTATEDLFKLWENDKNPPIVEVLQAVHNSGLFAIPDSLYPIVSRTEREVDAISKNAELNENIEDTNEELIAWEIALSQPFLQIEKYNDYLSEHSKFGTHQGVKGLEYPRVMVILDDEEAGGFSFSYDKVFGAKALSSRDQKNIEEGKETGIDRTKRLFYVTCSRACESLAIVAYTDHPEIVKENALAFNWFAENEIEIFC